MAIGAGIALTVPIVLPVIINTARPLLKGVVKGYLALSHSVRETVAEARAEYGELVNQ
jgi:hypothetical protein